MNKKSVSASTLVLFLALFFSVIGACFATFAYKDTRILIDKIKIVSSDAIDVYADKDLKKKAKELDLSDMQLGLKPATGELDQETQIPSTITDDGTSEGYYSTVYLKTSTNYKIVVKNIKIETKNNQIEVDEQKKNVFVSIKDVNNTTKSLKESEVEVVSFSNVETVQELTFLVWLGSLSEDVLEGSKISFDLEFVAI